MGSSPPSQQDLGASAFWKSPIDGGKQIGVREVQVSRGRGDVGMAHKALHYMDVLATADEARRIAVTPAVSEVPSGHAR